MGSRGRRSFKPLVALGVAAVGAFALAFLLWASDGANGGTGRPAGLSSRGSKAGAAGRGGIPQREVDAAGNGRVRGRVIDGDGAPVDHGQVVLQCLTDASVRPIVGGVVRLSDAGEFAGPGCRGEVCVELRHPFLVPAQPWLLRVGEPAQLEARALPRLHAQVVTADGRPVAAARVSFARGDDDPDPTVVLPLMNSATSTDADGQFSVAWIERPPCGPCEAVRNGCERSAALPVAEHVRVFVRAEGLGPAQRVVTRDYGVDPDEPVLIVLPEAADVLSGQLVDATGRVYPRAFVLARSLERRQEQHRADVHAGNFEFESLGEGAYDLRALQDGVELAGARGVRAGDDVEMVGAYYAGGPDLVVRLLDARGHAVRGAAVEGGPFAGDHTDMQGEVRASAVLSGTLRLRIHPPGQPAVLRQVEVAERNPREGGVPVLAEVELDPA